MDGIGLGCGLLCLTPLSTIFQWWSALWMEETGVPGENHFRHVKCCDMTQILYKVTLNTHDSNLLLCPRFKISTLKMIKIRKLSKIKLHLYISVVIYLVMIYRVILELYVILFYRLTIK